MKSLDSIQKTFKVFKTLSMIAMITSFAAAGAALLGLICVTAWQSKGMIGLGRSVMALTGEASLEPAICALLADAVFALTDGLLFLSAWNYFRAEQADGTPFTHGGADQIRRLGIRTIVLPIVAIVISAVIYGCFEMRGPADWSNAASIVLGVALILASLVFRYGADLEARAKEGGAGGEA